MANKKLYTESECRVIEWLAKMDTTRRCAIDIMEIAEQAFKECKDNEAITLRNLAKKYFMEADCVENEIKKLNMAINDAEQDYRPKYLPDVYGGND